MTLSGRVFINATRLPPPANLAGALLTLSAPTTQVNPMNQLMGISSVISAGRQNAKPDGTFEIGGLAPGMYHLGGAYLNNESPQDVLLWRVSSVVIDRREVIDLPIEIKPNVDLRDVAVTFSDAFQELSGVISDASGQPLTASTVILFATDKRYWYRDSRRVLTTRPGTDGHYEFTGVLGPAAGEYLLSVVTDLDPSQRYDVSFLETLAKSSPVKLTFAPGEKKTQNLRTGGQP
jgi:hypothetical protein